MKRVIDGRSYNTETAIKLCSLESPTPYTNDFHWHNTILYQTKGGAFFLAGEGGAMSRWSKPCGQNSRVGGEGISPVSAAEAKEILERENATEALERVFGQCPEAGEGEAAILVRLPANVATSLKRQAAEDGKSLNQHCMTILSKAR